MQYIPIMFLLCTLIYANGMSFGQGLLPNNDNALISRIAFGSCSKESKAQPILETIVSNKPELFIYLGDNIYGDTEDMGVLRNKYDRLGAKPEFQKLKETCPLIATWDDHDYGKNDAGKEYPKKEESKKVMLEFFEETATSARWEHEGIYTSYFFKDSSHTLQIILLDNRTFRSSICVRKRTPKRIGIYWPCKDTSGTMLGEQQWAWLEEQLLLPADLRIIGTSTQFLADFNGYEAWANMPWERDKMLRLIKRTKAKGVLFISGDTHYAELSKLERIVDYPVYDMTSSGLTQTWPSLGPNKNRIHNSFSKVNFGWIEIDWSVAETVISIEVRDLENKVRISEKIRLSRLQ